MNPTIRKIHQELDGLYGSRETDAMIRIIFRYLKGWTPVDIIVNGDRPFSDFIQGEVDKIIGRLKMWEPIQYIVGTADFYGMELKVSPGVLVPRPETAELVDWIVDTCKTGDLNVLDVGTGSGCIAIALARNLRFPRVTALDLSAEAIRIAEENARNLKCRINFIQADIFAWNPPAGSFDIIVSNPPYIVRSEAREMERNVLEYEPDSALFVPDGDPLRFYRRISGLGREALSDGGYLFFEINPLFVRGLRKLLEDSGYHDVEVRKDSYGKDRFIKARR